MRKWRRRSVGERRRSRKTRKRKTRRSDQEGAGPI